MILIGICGASGSGKSTLADALANRLGDRCLVIQQDCYYRDHPDLSFTERAKLNYDEPGIFDHDLLLHDMNTLISGQPITRKAYDYTQHRRADTDELISRLGKPSWMRLLAGCRRHCADRIVQAASSLTRCPNEP